MGKKFLAVLLSAALLVCAAKYDVLFADAAASDDEETTEEVLVEETDLSEESVEELNIENIIDIEPATDTKDATEDVPVITMPENGETNDEVVLIPEGDAFDKPSESLSGNEDVSGNEDTFISPGDESVSFESAQKKGSVLVMIYAQAGVFPKGTTAIITELTDESTVKGIEEAVSKELDDNKVITQIKAYDITMFDSLGNEVQPDTSKGSVTVSFKNIDTAEAMGSSDKDIEVFHVEESFNNAEAMDTSLSYKEVSFEAEHFSQYAVVSIEDKAAGEGETDPNALIEAFSVTVGGKPLKDLKKISASDTISVVYNFRKHLVINPEGSSWEDYGIKAGHRYPLPSIPKECAKGRTPVDVKGGTLKLGVIEFDADGNATLVVDSSFTEMQDANNALAGFDLQLDLSGSSVNDDGSFVLKFGDDSFDIKVAEYCPQPPKVAKTASNLDADNNITWTVTVTNDAKPIDYKDGIILKDTFSEGQAYVEGSLEDGAGNKITPTASGSTITWSHNDDTASKVTTYKYKTHIDFLALTKDENANKTVNKSVSNKIQATAPAAANGDYDALDYSTQASSSVSKTVNEWVHKEGTEVDKDGKATWTVTVRNNEFTLKNVVLHDEIVADDGIEIVMSDIKVTDSKGNVAFTDKMNGSVHDIAFTDVMKGNAVYTVTYTTQIKDYAAFLKRNHSVPKNNAWITYEYDATGKDGWVNVKGPTVETSFKGKNLMSDAAIRKSAAGIDRVNHQMDWLVTINNNEQDLEGVYVIDDLPEGNTYVTIKDVKIGTEAGGFTDALEGTDYEVTEISDKQIKVDFKNNVKEKTAKFVLTTKLTQDESKVWASNKTKDYTNYVTLYSDGNEEVKAKATQTYKSNVIMKSAGDYDYNTHIIPYTITVNDNKMEMKNVVVSDVLASNLEYVEGSSNFASNTSYDKNTNTLVFNFDKITDTTVITFNAKVKDGDHYKNNGNFTISNKASLKSKDYDKETEDSSKDTKIENEAIKKSALRNKEKIDYTVKINAAQQNLYEGNTSQVYIEDTLGASLVLDEDSIKLYEADVSNKGVLSKGSEVTGIEPEFDYSTPKTILKVPIPKSGANKAYILEYRARMLKESANDFSNNVLLKGYGSEALNKSDYNFKASDFTDVDFSLYTYYISLLLDENDDKKKLEGAHFKLFDPSKSNRLVGEADSDKDGRITFVGTLDENHLYILKETDAPDGYEIPLELAEGKEVYTKGKGRSIAIEGIKDNTFTNSKPSKEVTFNLLDNSDKKTDLVKNASSSAKISVYKSTKEVWNSDSTEPFKAVYGIEYEVKESLSPYEYHGDAKEGYKFMIDETTKELTLLSSSSNAVLSGNKITMYDSMKESMKISVDDISEAQGKPLKGAKFVLKDKKGVVKEWESDGITKDITLPEGDYTLERTIAPNGFLTESKLLKFSIKKNLTSNLLEIDPTDNSTNLEIIDSKIVVPEKTDVSKAVKNKPGAKAGPSINVDDYNDMTLTPVKYDNGVATGLEDTPYWTKADGTDLTLQPQVEYVLTTIDKTGKKVSTVVMIDENGKLVSKDYVAPMRTSLARPSSSSKGSDHLEHFDTKKDDNKSSENVSAPSQTINRRTLAKTGGFVGTIAGYGAGVLMIVGGIFMIVGKKKKTK